MQWEAPRYLAQANSISRIPSAVTGYFGITKGTVSQTRNPSEHRGLVRKISAAGERLSVTLDLTVVGRDLLREDLVSTLPVAATVLPNPNE